MKKISLTQNEVNDLIDLYQTEIDRAQRRVVNLKSILKKLIDGKPLLDQEAEPVKKVDSKSIAKPAKAEKKEKVQKEPVSDVTYGIPQPKNPDINGIMSKAIANVMDPKGVTITYNMRYKDLKGKQSNATNGIAKIKGDKFYVFAHQFESWYNGTTQWTLQRGAKEVTVSTPTDA